MALARDTSAFTRSRRNRRTTRVLQKFPEGPSSMRVRPTAQLDRTQVRDLRGKDVGSREFAHRDAPGRIRDRTEKPRWVLKSQDTSRARARNRQGLPVYVERDKGDPIGGFLGAVKKAVTFGNDEVIRTAKGIYKGLNENVESNVPGTGAWDRRRERERGQQMSLDISPGAVGALIRAGGGKLLLPRGTNLNLRELYERIPDAQRPSPLARRGGLNQDYVDDMQEAVTHKWVEDVGVPDRLPWIVDRRTGTPNVLPPGYQHAAWSGYDDLPTAVQTGPLKDKLLQGWVYSADPEVSLVELGAKGLRHTTDWNAKEQKGLIDLLTLMFGKNSPVTDDMVRPFGDMFGFAPKYPNFTLDDIGKAGKNIHVQAGMGLFPGQDWRDKQRRKRRHR